MGLAISVQARPEGGKTRAPEIHKVGIVKPDLIPPGSVFKGYNDYVVQDIIFEPPNTGYRLECRQTPEGEYVFGKLPDQPDGSHFGHTLRNFILHRHYHGHVTQPLIAGQLRDIGIHIPSGQISNILIENKDLYHSEKNEILQAGLSVSDYIGVDDRYGLTSSGQKRLLHVCG